MAQVVRLKRTSVEGRKPTTSNLELGELAINTHDGKIYFEKDSGTPSIREIATEDTYHFYTTSLDSRYVNLTGNETIAGNKTFSNNVTISGNLSVEGTTTTIDSTTLNIGDNTLELNYGGSQTTGGILVKDATSSSTVSGSLLWDSSNDFWKAGKLGSESELITTSNIVTKLPTGTISGSSQISLSGFNTSQLSENTNLYYTDTRVKTKLDADSVISGSNLEGMTVSGSFSGSFQGDGSNLTGLSVDQVATVTDTFSNVTSKVVTHNFGTKNVIVTVYGDDDSYFIPSSIVTTNTNQVTVTFASTESGRIVVAKGGHVVQGTASDANLLDGEDGTYYLNYGNFTNIPSGIVSGSTQLNSTTISALNLNAPVFGTGSNSPYFTEVRYNNSNVMEFNQMYKGDASGDYLETNEYQKVVTIVPGANSQNYQILGRITAQSGGATHIVNFNAALRSNTLPDLDWGITYDDNFNIDKYIEPQLWTKETSTAGFIFAFKVVKKIFGTVTVDMQVIPRDSNHLSNVSVNSVQSSEQDSIDSGYTANTFDRSFSINGSNALFTNGIVSGSSQISDLTTHKQTVTGATSYVVDHNLDEQYPIVQAWNTVTSKQELPNSITTNSVNRVTVDFSTTFAGKIIVKK